MGNRGSSPAPTQAPSNFVASGHGVYVNSNGESVIDSFRHVNGETYRETITPSGTVPQYPTSQLPAVYIIPTLAAAVMMVLFVALFMYSRQTKRPVKRTVAVTDDVEQANSTPLYTLNSKPRHASEAMWNIDLLDDE